MPRTGLGRRGNTKHTPDARACQRDPHEPDVAEADAVASLLVAAALCVESESLEDADPESVAEASDALSEALSSLAAVAVPAVLESVEVADWSESDELVSVALVSLAPVSPESVDVAVVEL